MEQSHAYFLEDMLVEILVRLPIKSVVRFRCVCKSWYRIIGSSCFIKSQLSAAVPNPSNLYLLCEYGDFYTLICQEKSSDDRMTYCYTPELFLKNKRLDYPARVPGSCKGVLCLSDKNLCIRSIIYLWNPVIRKAKQLPKIPIDGPERRGDASLCFGYFDDDYKVIRIGLYQGNYRVGVYSLNADSWKIIYCDSEDGSFNWWCVYASSRCVGGVAYLAKYRGRIVCFDMHDHRIREVALPESFGPSFRSWFFMEACGESIGLVQVRDGILAQWVLRDCGVNYKSSSSSSWEKKLIVDLKAFPDCLPLGFASAGKYVLMNSDQWDEFYLCDFEKSELRDFTIRDEKKACMYALESLVGSLALLDEKETIDPFEEMEPACSVQTRFVFYRKRPRKKRRKREIVHQAQNKLQGERSTKPKM